LRLPDRLRLPPTEWRATLALQSLSRGLLAAWVMASALSSNVFGCLIQDASRAERSIDKDK